MSEKNGSSPEGDEVDRERERDEELRFAAQHMHDQVSAKVAEMRRKVEALAVFVDSEVIPRRGQ